MMRDGRVFDHNSRAPGIAILLCLTLLSYAVGLTVWIILHHDEPRPTVVVKAEKRVPLPRQCAHLLGEYEDWAWNEETDLYPRNHKWATCMMVEYK